MDNHVHEGKLVIDVEGREHTVYYEISNYREGFFNLCVFYNGKKQLDRVPAQSFDLHNDVERQHGPVLFKALLASLNR